MSDDMREKLDAIGREAAEVFGCTMADILSPSRETDVADARAVAMWVAMRLLRHASRTRIANGLGRKEGQAVTDAERRVVEMRFSPRKRMDMDRVYDKFHKLYGITPLAAMQRFEPPEVTGGNTSATEAAWGFTGYKTTGNRYFEEQNDRFAKAMIQAGYTPHRGDTA